MRHPYRKWVVSIISIYGPASHQLNALNNKGVPVIILIYNVRAGIPWHARVNVKLVNSAMNEKSKQFHQTIIDSMSLFDSNAVYSKDFQPIALFTSLVGILRLLEHRAPQSLRKAIEIEIRYYGSVCCKLYETR